MSAGAAARALSASASHALGREEIEALGFAAVGADVRIHPTVQVFGAGRIRIGDHVRIDAFCLLSAGGEAGSIVIGDHVHLGAATMLFGGGGVAIDDFAGTSGRVTIYSATDDYGGEYLTNPTTPLEHRREIAAPVRLKPHAIVGAAAVVMPGVTLGEGAAVGAMSYVERDVPDFCVAMGYPARVLGRRERGLLARAETVKPAAETVR